MSEKNTRTTVVKGIKAFNEELTIKGGIQSIVNQAQDGAAPVIDGLDKLKKSNTKSLKGGRIESFEMAMERQNVKIVDLALIHNQIVAQTYFTLCASLICVSMCARYAFFSEEMIPVLLSGVLSLLGFVFFFQAGLQAFQIRERKLGLLSKFILSPGDWIPSRIDGLKKMSKTDPLRKPEVVHPLVKKARLNAFIALGCIGVAGGLLIAINQTIAQPWSLAFIFTATILFVSSGKNSFEVYKRREAIHCDVLMWLSSVKDWIPSLEDNRTDSYVSLTEKIESKKSVTDSD